MGVSLKPSTYTEGGVVPVDKDLTIIGARFNVFSYTNKAGEIVATTVAARIQTRDNDGVEFTQQYSVGDPKEWSPSEDNKNAAQEGKYLIAVGQRTEIVKTSNFAIFMGALIDAGWPEDKLAEDISVLEGLYAHFIGKEPPKRAGLQTPTDPNARARVLSIPDVIHKLPWEKAKGGKSAAAAKPGTAAKPAEDTAVAAAVEFAVTELGENEDSMSLQDLAQAVFSKKKGADRNAIAKVIYTAPFQAALLAKGYMVGDDQMIAKAD